ncbi:DUF262 domain-containing protein [Apilactobacillus micheneri]|uniref:DUF262 domain-containing protein n=1 Tax=Apilactobacillus micheneri TaxID=1899430 RepID=UPI001126473D|nr:DUF262 domain-containing protein [Apilactobacillus micheneri]TPR45492.1 DUF262 domain-containing protein [Apilactobacillus micheneri]TPR48938.1 DUF262 domain-containing protein [Apilactobacillus micheneri]
MKADSTSLFEYLSQSKVVFEIPIYQRNYEWGKEQCEQMFKDLTNLAGENNVSNNEHFLGTIVYVKKSGENLSSIERIIDGQQRTTSCMLLLKALSVLDKNISDEIRDQYLKNTYLKYNDHLKLRSVKRDRLAYKYVMENRVNEYNHSSKIIDNYKYFLNEVENSYYSPKQLFDVMSKFNIVYIELDDNVNGENPQVIFESLNSTGVSLSATDLIRNYLLMRLDTKEQEDLYQRYWIKIEKLFTNDLFMNFIKDYLVEKRHTNISKKYVYKLYKSFYEDKGFDAKSALKDLYKYSKYYDIILNEKSENKKFNKILKNIKILDKKIVYPYFLKLLRMKDEGNMEWEEIIDISLVWQSYFFRRLICDIKNQALIRAITSLTSDDHSDLTEKERVEQRLLNNHFPDDSYVIESMKTFDLYSKKHDVAKLILSILEENRSKENIDFNDAQVEHIMPQKLSNDWKIDVPNADLINDKYGGTIGNLTLTKYNQEMSNKTFRYKKDFYKNSNIIITREIPKFFNSWDQNSIEKRTSILCNEFVEIFPRPKNYNDNIISYGEHNINDVYNVTGAKLVTLTIDDKDYSVSSWRKSLILLLDKVWNYDSASFDKLKEDESLSEKLFNLNDKPFHAPHTLSNGVNIETNFNSNTILAMLSKISEIYGVSDEIYYTIK